MIRAAHLPCTIIIRRHRDCEQVEHSTGTRLAEGWAGLSLAASVNTATAAEYCGPPVGRHHPPTARRSKNYSVLRASARNYSTTLCSYAAVAWCDERILGL